MNKKHWLKQSPKINMFKLLMNKYSMQKLIMAKMNKNEINMVKINGFK